MNDITLIGPMPDPPKGEMKIGLMPSGGPITLDRDGTMRIYSTDDPIHGPGLKYHCIAELKTFGGEAQVVRSGMFFRYMDFEGECKFPVNLLSGIPMIAKERYRQAVGKGFNMDHDQKHPNGELAIAAAYYAIRDIENVQLIMPDSDYSAWPWHENDFKPTVPIENLVKAGALIAAEIDRRLRAGEKHFE